MSKEQQRRRHLEECTEINGNGSGCEGPPNFKIKTVIVKERYCIAYCWKRMEIVQMDESYGKSLKTYRVPVVFDKDEERQSKLETLHEG